MLFRGHDHYTIDAKKRLNVPAKFRPALAHGLVQAKWVEPCISIWTPAAFEAFTTDLLERLGPVAPERRKLTRHFAGYSFDSELDSAGRVTLNPNLIGPAEIEKEVVVVGMIDHLEVWSRDRWLADQEELNAEIVGIAESLGHPS
jgi:MraZ protein